MATVRFGPIATTNWDAVVDSFHRSMGRPKSATDLAPLFVAAAAILAVWVVIIMYDRRRRRFEEAALPQTLFDEAAAAHELTELETQGLLELARANSLDEPTELFVRPELWSLASQLPEPHAETCARLEHRLIPPIAPAA